jgi:hypothetical protein
MYKPTPILELMQDVEILLEHRPGTLAAMGEALGAAGVSVEGGGGWHVDDRVVAHFLFADAAAARAALECAGIIVGRVSDVIAVRLRQDQPGQLGALARRMAIAGVNIEVMYSDHDHRLILVVDDPAKARTVADEWITAAV